MSKTYRVNPESFEEEQERNYLKRKKKEEQKRKQDDLSWIQPYENFPDDCWTYNERDE